MAFSSSHFFLAILFLLLFSTAYACTGITVKPKDGSIISSRTLEFGVDLKSDIILIPRNYQMHAVLPDRSSGIKWTQKYATIGFNGLNELIISEGFNEKGLAAGSFYLPSYTQYAKLTSDNTKKAMLSSDFPTWILGNFSSVDEVKANLDKFVIVEGSRPGTNIPLPLHYRITDSSGKVIVIEFINNGQMKVYDDPLGVITNSPTFDWHITNLSNYVNLTAVNVPPANLSGEKIQSLGQGSGMLGLPGDYTPPSRFVRILAIQESSLPVNTADEGVILAWNIINNVNIPKGAAREVSPNGETHYDYTEWVSVSDLRNLKLYFRTYENPEIRTVAMKDLNLDGKDVMRISITTSPQFRNVASDAKRADFD